MGDAGGGGRGTRGSPSCPGGSPGPPRGVTCGWPGRAIPWWPPTQPRGPPEGVSHGQPKMLIPWWPPTRPQGSPFQIVKIGLVVPKYPPCGGATPPWVHKGGDPCSSGTPNPLQAPKGTGCPPRATRPRWMPSFPSLAAFVAPKDKLFYGFLKPWLGEWGPWAGVGRAAPMGAPQMAQGASRRGRAAAEPRGQMGPAPAPADARLPLRHPQVLREHLQQQHPHHAREHRAPAPRPAPGPPLLAWSLTQTLGPHPNLHPNPGS